MERIYFTRIENSDINTAMLDNFNRQQEVKRFYKKENGNWTIGDCDYIANWDKNKKVEIIKSFENIAANERGCIFGAYDHENLLGFAALLHERFGKGNQYIELKYLHVSFDYRHKGIGKRLFESCIDSAKKMGAKKIYISANSAEESQRFYLSMGCTDAVEINQALAANEPYDRQMEYAIGLKE